MKISIVGAGAWSTAIARLLIKNGHEVTLCARRRCDADKMKEVKENKKHLPGVKLPNSLKFSWFEEIPTCDIAVFGVPAQHVRETLEFVKFKADGIVNLAKGIEIKTLKRMEEVFKEYIKNIDYASLSGPSHAEEVATDIPTSVVVSSRKFEFSEIVQKLFSSSKFRVYTSEDLTGIEVGGALKNVIAIAAGVVDGLGGWDNSKAAIVTRGLAEITRIGVKLGAHPLTFMGLSGLGDLVVTCTSRHSRNRKVGEIIGKGLGVPKESTFIAEGLHTVVAELNLAKRLHVEVPIAQAVYSLVYEGISPKAMVFELMNRPLKKEHEWNVDQNTNS